MSTLERAIVIAAKAHEGQFDKGGAPYILHPLHVMLNFSTNEERITAVLHDVVEDSRITLENLRSEGFSESIIEAIDAVTIRLGEAYESFVQRAASNPIGRKVKLADLQHNCDLSRIPNPTASDYERSKKYSLAIETILNIEDKTNI